jgi:hypothetical protein
MIRDRAMSLGLIDERLARNRRVLVVENLGRRANPTPDLAEVGPN